MRKIITNLLPYIALILIIVCFNLIFFWIKTDFSKGFFAGTLSTGLIAYAIYESEKHKK